MVGHIILAIILELSKAHPLFATLVGIYIKKLEGCLEEVSCVETMLAEIVIMLPLYVDDILFLWQGSPMILRSN